MRNLPILTDAEEAIEHYHAAHVEPLTDAERALVVAILSREGFKNSAIRKSLGISKVYTVTHLKRVGLSLTDVELALWHKNPKRITLGHTRAISKLPQLQREDLLRSLLSKRISVSDFERIAKGAGEGRDLDIARFVVEVGEQLGRPTTIKYNTAKQAGRLTLAFYGLDDLDYVLSRLGYQKEL